ncbi:MAG: cell division protein SepF [Clostridiales bacterium]|nr:cell division protein SepF [Clostridiales bacterium]
MGVMDKFLNAMRLNSDEDDYFEDDDFYDDEEEEVEEYVPPKKPARRERRKQQEEEEYVEETSFTTVKKEPSKPAQSATTRSTQSSTNSKVTPMRPSRKPQGGQAVMEVCVIKPSSVEDAREITETLLAGRTVVLNLEGLDLEIAQRIIDFTSGSCFAIDGNLQKISNYIFIVTPRTVDISGDFQDIMSAFDASSLQADI